MEESLHPRRERILRFLARRVGGGEPPPSVREVGAEVGLRSSQTVHHHLRKLEAVATDEAYSLAAELLASRSGRRRYLLRVVGRSMVGARIEDGDLLVVEEDESPPDGSIVVVLLREGEEVTVKRFYREGEMLRLKPEAPQGGYEEMVVPAEEVRVQGRVVYVLHPPGTKSLGGSRV